MNPHNLQSLNSEDENEHFNLSDSIISWMENFKSLPDEDSKNALAHLLPPPLLLSPSSSSPPAYHHNRSAAKCVAWNLVRIFGERQNLDAFRTGFDDYNVKYSFDLSGNYQDVEAGSNHSNGLSVGSYSVDDQQTTVYSDEFQKITGEFLLIPKNQTIQSTVINEENVDRLIKDKNRSRLVINSLLKWLAEPTNYNQLDGLYSAANHLVKTILEMMSTTEQVDAYHGTLIEVCLAHPESVQIFSPYLTPSACSNQVFLDLYKTICSKQTVLGPNTTFVLLSKFDLNAYLNANPECRHSHHELIVATCSAFKDIGKNPEELTMDLFKRHLQIELAAPDRCKSDELLLVFGQFLDAMNEKVLAPDLWLYYLTIIGLEIKTNKTKVNHLGSKLASNLKRNSSQTTMTTTSDDPIGASIMTEHSASLGWVAESVSRFADCQSVFNYQSLDKLVKMICELIKEGLSSSSVTSLELYKDYLEQYGMVMLSVTFMWLKSISELHPNNHELIWKQFMDIWVDWIFLTKNCQKVSKSSYSLMVNYFVMSLQYMIHLNPESTEPILRSLLSKLSDSIAQTRDTCYLELQACLKNLPWSGLLK